jgi:hypothetical protein
LLAGDPQHRLELRGVAHGYLQEEHWVAGGDVVVRAFLAFLLDVLALVALVRLVGDDADLPAGRLLDEAPGGLSYLDLGHAQLGGPSHPGDQRGGDDRGDENGGNLDAIGSVEDVRDGGIAEEERDDAKGDGSGSLAAMPHHRQRARVLGDQQVAPVGHDIRVPEHMHERDGHHDEVEREVDRHDADAIPIASPKPLRKTPPSSAISNRVTATAWPSRKTGTNGFSRTCAVASAAERVMVITKSVATNPSSTSTNSLPCHHDSSRSSIEIDPASWGLSRATRR